MQGAGSLAFSLPASSVNYGTTIDGSRAIAKTFDATTGAIKCVDTSTASGDRGTSFDTAMIWQAVFDPTNSAIRITFV